MNIPDSQTSLLGDKTVAELGTFSVRVEDKTTYVSGNSKNIVTPWTAFSPTGDNTGHFAVVKLPDFFAGQKVELTAGSGNNKTWDNFDADCILITRLDGYTADKTQKFKIGGETVLTADYSGVTLDS